MITFNVIPKFISVRLSDEQWEALAHVINEDDKSLIDDIETRHKLDATINHYLWSTFIDRQGAQPGELKKPFDKLIELSHDLILFFEKYFFPTPQEYTDPLCIEIIERRDLKSKHQDELPLVVENSNIEKTALDYNNAYRNNLIRRQISDMLCMVPQDFNSQPVNQESLLRSIHDLKEAAKAASKILPSAKGKHGDPYFERLINDAQRVYCEAGEKGFYSERAISFMELFIEYVTEFARLHIGADHADALEGRTENGQLVEWIRRARTKQKKEEKKRTDELAKMFRLHPNAD